MKLAVVGSRDFDDYDKLCSVLNKLDNIDLLISGGADGADTLAEVYAIINKIPKKIFYAIWYIDGIYHMDAGYKRNIKIIEKCDCCIAFWNGVSKGTEHSIKLCNSLNKPCTIIRT